MKPRRPSIYVNMTMAAAAKAAPRKREAGEEGRGDYILRARNIPGLGLRIYENGHKVWIYQRKQNGKPIRVVLGEFPTLTLEDRYNGNITISGARTLAAEAAAKILKGLDPNLEKREQLRKTAEALSVEALRISVIWRGYLLDRLEAVGEKIKNHDDEDKKTSGAELDKLIDEMLDRAVEAEKLSSSTVSGWKKAGQKLSHTSIWTMPFLSVTGNDLKKTFHQLEHGAKRSTSSNKGKTQAAGIMRSLRAAYNWGIKARKLTPSQHAFEELNDLLKGWYQVAARNRIVANSEGDLARWWEAVEALRAKSDHRSRDATTIADYLVLSLMWGGRKTETLSLKWSEVDLQSNVVSFIKTKNGKIHDIPLAPFARSIIARRKAENDKRVPPSEYVFPASRTGKKTRVRGHLQEPKVTLGAVAKASGIKFSPHDLRRTFGVLLNEQDVSKYVIERALNHSPADTAAKHYLHQRLKGLMRVYTQLEEIILTEAGVKKAKNSAHTVPADQWEKFQIWQATQAVPVRQKRPSS